jgi:hypothetical protein
MEVGGRKCLKDFVCPRAKRLIISKISTQAQKKLSKEPGNGVFDVSGDQNVSCKI